MQLPVEIELQTVVEVLGRAGLLVVKQLEVPVRPDVRVGDAPLSTYVFEVPDRQAPVEVRNLRVCAHEGTQVLELVPVEDDRELEVA